MLITDYTIALAGTQDVRCISTHNRSIIAILTGRRSASLHVSKDGCPCLNTGSSLDTSCHRSGMTDTLCIDNNVMGLAALSVGNNIINNLLLIVIIFLRKQNIFCTIGNTTPQCNVSGISAHNLNDTATFMGRRCISYLINSLHRCINCCIESNRILCTGNIQIDRSRNTDGINTMLSQCLRTTIRAVSADDNQAINPMFMADIGPLLLTLLRTELVTPCRT